METIYALSSATGKAGVAVIRVSGSLAVDSFLKLTNNPLSKPPKARQAIYSNLYHPKTKLLIDKAIVIYFKAPASFTGEDIIEYHIHGGNAGINMLLDALFVCEGLRIAEAGEFTKRAVLNSKIDLTEAEAIADIINAETEEQHKIAISQHAGELRKIYEDWTKRLIEILAHQEAEIEFPDEDMPDGLSKSLIPKIENLLLEIKAHLNDNNKGERLRSGISIVIIGAPNVGKSSLINLLAKRDIAIVSNIAGTTRDIVEVNLNIAGYPVIISDTAGIREKSDNQIEQEGIKRAKEKAKTADIKILMFDTESEIDERQLLDANSSNSMIVINKIDRGDIDVKFNKIDIVKISVKDGVGIDILLEKLTKIIKANYNAGKTNTPLLTRARHRDNLEKCQAYLKSALTNDMAELVAEDIRLALRHLGRLTGRVDVEDLLDVIFKDFCIGK